ncbi:MAG: hypothetical protein LBQ60_21495, partial [Bacteroidales bacterium]|nr:hypothetical protein [Bacteroidales bacterium]
LITNFILPLFVEKEKKEERDIHEERAYLDILHHVVKQLNLQTTKENKAATQVVVREYLSRIASIQNKKTSKSEDKKTEQRYRLMIVEWENKYVNELLARNEIDEDTALHYLDFTERQMSLGMKRNGFLRKIKKMITFLRHIRKFRRLNGKMSQLISRKRIFTLRKACDKHVLDNLKKMKETDHHPAIDQLISEYELSLSIQENMRAFKRSSKQSSTNAGVEEIAASGFQTERDQIQMMFENNRISRETAKNMRNNIALLEMQFKE